MTVFTRRGLCVAACAAVTATCLAGAGLAQTNALRIGTSSSGSIYYTLAVGLGSLLSKYASIPATAEPVGGSTANIFALDANKVDIAITNSGASYDGYHAVAPFKKPIKVGLIAQGQPSYRQMIVRVGSGIDKPEDLKGKTVIGRRPALPEIEQVTLALLKVYGMSAKDIKMVTTTNTGEAVNALKSNTVDAVMIPASKGASYIQSLLHDGKIKFLQIPDDKIKAMMAILPKSLSAGKLPANSYTGQDKPVNVIKLATYLVAADRLSDDTVYKVTKTLFDHIDEFHGFHASAKEWTLEETLDDPKIPYDPGAIRYFKEKGVWTDAMEKAQAELLKQ